MKKTNTHFTQEKKEYSQPVLKKIGLVSDLTKAQKGSTGTDTTLQTTFEENE